MKIKRVEHIAVAEKGTGLAPASPSSILPVPATS